MRLGLLSCGLVAIASFYLHSGSKARKSEVLPGKLLVLNAQEFKKTGVTIDIKRVLPHEGKLGHASDQLLLNIALTPVEQLGEKMHFYDSSLPLNGLDGVGRPTRVEVKEFLYFKHAKHATVIESLVPSSDKLKKYPDGPVNLLLALTPKNIDSIKQYAPVTFLMTYMACGESICNMPVTQKPLKILIPRRWISEASMPSSLGRGDSGLK